VSVTIAVPGKFQPAYHFAKHLEHAGRLERLIRRMGAAAATVPQMPEDFGRRMDERVLAPLTGARVR